MIEVRVTFGHLDRLPRCVSTRLAVPFCSHCSERVWEGQDRPPFAVKPSFHTALNTQGGELNHV